MRAEPLFQIDHIILGAPRLEEGVQSFRELAGVELCLRRRAPCLRNPQRLLPWAMAPTSK
ncbi:MAG: hypothetical protein R2724_14140 [Bryobacterales bacterium]